MENIQYLNISVLSVDVNCEVTLTKQIMRKIQKYHAFSFVNAEKEKLFAVTQSTMPAAIKLFSETQELVGNPAFPNVSRTHTHKYTYDRFGTNMAPN